MVRHQGLRLRAAKLAAAAQALKRRSGAGAQSAAAPVSLAFLTDRRRAPHPLLIARVLPAGAAVVLRDYDMAGRAGLAAQLKSVCVARRLRLVIGADAALAQKVGADGIHYPRWRAPSRPAPEGMFVTAACHDTTELERAAAFGAHLAFVSPVFPTDSHREAVTLGPDKFKELAASAKLPVLALGGVDETNALLLSGPNVAGVAAIGAFLE